MFKLYVYSSRNLHHINISADLTSFLTIQFEEVPIKDLEDFVSMTEAKLLIAKSTNVDALLEVSDNFKLINLNSLIFGRCTSKYFF